MRKRTFREWFQWGGWARYMFSRLLDPEVFFVIAWQKYGEDGARVTVRFHASRPDKRLNELHCLQVAVNGQIEEEKRKLKPLAEVVHGRAD